MHAYVINLTRSHDRRAYIVAHLDIIGINYEIVTGIDGRQLDLSNSSIVTPSFRASAALPAGSAGAALSHLAVYRKIIADGLDMALVLEDDVILPADLDALADAAGKELAGAEVALLSVDGWQQQAVTMSTQGTVPLPSARFLALPIDVRMVLSAGAYIITREACERMIERNFPIRSVADSWARFYDEGTLDRVRCVTPMPVCKNHNFASTIGSYSLGSGVLGRLAAAAMRYRIPVLHQVLAYRRRHIFRIVRYSELSDEPFVQKPSRLDLVGSADSRPAAPSMGRRVLARRRRRRSSSDPLFIKRRLCKLCLAASYSFKLPLVE